MKVSFSSCLSCLFCLLLVIGVSTLVLESYSFSKIKYISDSTHQNNRASECLYALSLLQFEENFDATHHHLVFSKESGIKRNSLLKMEGRCADVYSAAFDSFNPTFTTHSGGRRISRDTTTYGTKLMYGTPLCEQNSVSLNCERYCTIMTSRYQVPTNCIPVCSGSPTLSDIACQIGFQRLPTYDTTQNYNIKDVNGDQIKMQGDVADCKQKCIVLPQCGGFVYLGIECYFKSLDAEYEEGLTDLATAYLIKW